jgi:thiamine biosynthesis lipoprotein
MRPVTSHLAFLLLLACAGKGELLQDPGEGNHQIQRELALMGTQLQISITAMSRTQALKASEAAVRAMERAENRLSTWRPNSELSAVNRGGKPSAKLAAELELATHWAVETDGAFQPRAGALIKAWDLRGKGRIPSTAELELAANDRSQWEEGAFGKGAALDAALTQLTSSGATHAHLNLGGQIAITPGKSTRIQVSHPGDRQSVAVEFMIDGGSVATSANSEKVRTIDGLSIGHLLDPRTGRPAPDFGSVTVWAPTAMAADCLSTGLFAMGPDEAMKWAIQQDQVEVLILIDAPARLLIRATPKLAKQLSILKSAYTPQDNRPQLLVQ